MKLWSKANEISAESGSFPSLTQAVRKPEHPESGLANTVDWLSLLKRSGNALSNPLYRAAYVCSAGAEVRLPLLSILAQANGESIWRCFAHMWTAFPKEWGNRLAEDALPNKTATSSIRCWPLLKSRIKETLWIRPVSRACRHLSAFLD